jgi:hypothetical protein
MIWRITHTLRLGHTCTLLPVPQRAWQVRLHAASSGRSVVDAAMLIVPEDLGCPQSVTHRGVAAGIGPGQLPLGQVTSSTFCFHPLCRPHRSLGRRPQVHHTADCVTRSVMLLMLMLTAFVPAPAAMVRQRSLASSAPSFPPEPWPLGQQYLQPSLPQQQHQPGGWMSAAAALPPLQFSALPGGGAYQQVQPGHVSQA